MTDTNTLQEITAAVRGADPGLVETDEGFRVAVVLFASAQLGPDVEKLAVFTGYDRDWLDTIAARLEANGIWAGGLVDAAAWFEKDGALDFWMAVLVGQGMLERS